MKILNLAVAGFRSLSDVKWQPGNLNLIIGPNASGKSNLVRLLEMLSISAQGGLSKYVQREGGIEPLLWDGAVDGIEVSIKLSPSESQAEQQRSHTYQLAITRLGKTSGYRIDRELLGNFYKVDVGIKDQPFKLLERSPHRAVIFDEHEHGFVAPEESVPEEETLLSIAAGPFAKHDLITKHQREFASWSIYQDLHTNRDSIIRQPAIATVERRVAPDGQNLVSVLHTLYTSERYFKNEVNTAMKAAFGDEFEELIFPPAADQRVQLRVRWKSLRREQSAADLSDGTLRFLFLLAVLGSPNLPPLIAIDEPEIGLHPSMLPIIAEYASAAAARAQIIFTTHSPAFLDAFREATPTITVANSEQGKTNLRVLSGEKLSYWLKQYTLGEIYRTGELEAMEQ
jgi:predicted ATPase